MHFPCNMKLRSPIPDVNGQHLYVSGISLSGNRQMKGHDSLAFQNPECRCAMPRVVLHSISVGPVATRDLAISPCSFRLCKRRSAESRSSGSRATCPSNDRRLRLNRGIATRDFDVHEMLALANPDMPIFNGKWTPPCTCELTPSQLLRDLTVCGTSKIYTTASSRRFSSS
jgi:hypothetical protein